MKPSPFTGYRLPMKTHWIPLLLFLLSLAVRLLAIRLTQFDGLYGQDSFAYFDYALALRQALFAGELPPPFFWPLGYPLLVVLASLFAGAQPAAGQLTSVCTGAAIAPLVYWLVREYRPETYAGGIVAGLLAATAAQLTLSSISLMADMAALFWATLSAWLMVRYVQLLSIRWLAAAAVALSLATLTRWVYGLLVVPWGVAAWLAWRQANYSWRQMVRAAATAVCIGLALLTLHSAADLARAAPSYTGDLQVYSWHLANAFQKEMVNADGRFTYEYSTGYFYARPAFHPAYIFPLLAPFWLLGLWALRRQPAALAALLVGWLLTIYLFLAGVPWQNWRFPLSFFPPLLVLVGLGVDWLWQRLATRWRPLLRVYCALALLGSLVWTVRDVGRFAAWANERKETAVTIATALPPDTILIAFDLTGTLQHYTAVDTREIFNLTEDDLADILATQTAIYLLLNPDNILSQWVGKSPERNFTWLQTQAELTPIATYGSLVLYKISP
ncbi:MAG TPA: phospholipid carrier-dependent glycosyltransferase [Chloroflexota bacterium]|nr:phospholipid carrier-dependent glycosyltransferase [Chloroflexota bacterium]